jgi:hypothetical protein
LIGTLIAAAGLFPPGAFVRLANGETAIVVRRLIDPKHPVVYALHQDTTAPYESPKKRMTASHRDFEIVADAGLTCAPAAGGSSYAAGFGGNSTARRSRLSFGQ